MELNLHPRVILRQQHLLACQKHRFDLKYSPNQELVVEPPYFRNLSTNQIRSLIEFTTDYNNKDPEVLSEIELKSNSFSKEVRAALAHLF